MVCERCCVLLLPRLGKNGEVRQDANKTPSTVLPLEPKLLMMAMLQRSSGLCLGRSQPVGSSECGEQKMNNAVSRNRSEDGSTASEVALKQQCAACKPEGNENQVDLNTLYMRPSLLEAYHDEVEVLWEQLLCWDNHDVHLGVYNLWGRDCFITDSFPRWADSLVVIVVPVHAVFDQYGRITIPGYDRMTAIRRYLDEPVDTQEVAIPSDVLENLLCGLVHNKDAAMAVAEETLIWDDDVRVVLQAKTQWTFRNWCHVSKAMLRIGAKLRGMGLSVEHRRTDPDIIHGHPNPPQQEIPPGWQGRFWKG